MNQADDNRGDTPKYADFKPEKERQQYFDVDYEGLTIHDVEFLMGERELSPGSADNARSRIHQRILSQFLAFTAVGLELPDTSYETLGRHIRNSKVQDNSLYYGLLNTTSFILRLAQETPGINQQKLIEKAVIHNDMSLRDVTVDIEKVAWSDFDTEPIHEKIDRGESPTMEELGLLALMDELTDEVRQKVFDETGFQYR